MERAHLQLSLTSMLGLVACIALNLWLFRLGLLWGIVGLNITKHVAIAQLCLVTGVNRDRKGAPARAASAVVGLPRMPAAPLVTSIRGS